MSDMSIPFRGAPCIPLEMTAIATGRKIMGLAVDADLKFAPHADPQHEELTNGRN